MQRWALQLVPDEYLYYLCTPLSRATHALYLTILRCFTDYLPYSNLLPAPPPTPNSKLFLTFSAIKRFRSIMLL